MARVLVTGANGFVGRRLCEILLKSGYEVTAAVRESANASVLPQGTRVVPVSSLGPDTDWSQALQDAQFVVHLAARVHVMQDQAIDPLREFRKTNVEGTRRLAEQSARAGVRRLVYISSIKAMGEGSGESFVETMRPKPEDPYGISKREAEEALEKISAETGMQFAALRPPLIYGPGVKANFLSLMRAIEKGIPLPLGGIRNQRSLVFLDNFCDAIRLCLESPKAAGKIYLVSDGADLSTPQLIRGLAQALGKKPRLIPIPEGWLRAAGAVTGKSAAVSRLIGSLTLDIRGIRQDLGWQPPCSIQDGLGETARWYLQRKKPETL